MSGHKRTKMSNVKFSHSRHDNRKWIHDKNNSSGSSDLDSSILKTIPTKKNAVLRELGFLGEGEGIGGYEVQ